VPTRKIRQPAGQAIIKAMAADWSAAMPALNCRAGAVQALEAEYKALEYARSARTTVGRQIPAATARCVAAQPYRVGSQDCRQYTHTLSVGTAAEGRARHRLPQSGWKLDASHLRLFWSLCGKSKRGALRPHRDIIVRHNRQ
jgi:hypothetical protein